MSDAPDWFKLYPAKFLADAKIDALSTLELGACLKLLCRQWLDGWIPDDIRVLARLCRLDEASMADAWISLADFFPVFGPGKRANRFMWINRDKVVADLERRSDEGTRAARKRWDAQGSSKANGSPNGSPMPDPMLDKSRVDKSRVDQSRKSSSSEQENRSDKDIPKRLRPEPSRDACKLAALLKSEIQRNSGDFRITQAQERKWAHDADRIIRLDGRNPEEAAELIRYAQRDNFWRANILSMEKFRKQFDQLSLRAKGATKEKPLPADYVPASVQIKRGRPTEVPV